MIPLVIRGRGGGCGRTEITSDRGRVTTIVGEYVAPGGATTAIGVIAVGDTFENMGSRRRASTPEALLPLVVRDAPWDVV